MSEIAGEHLERAVRARNQTMGSVAAALAGPASARTPSEDVIFGSRTPTPTGSMTRHGPEREKLHSAYSWAVGKAGWAAGEGVGEAAGAGTHGGGRDQHARHLRRQAPVPQHEACAPATHLGRRQAESNWDQIRTSESGLPSIPLDYDEARSTDFRPEENARQGRGRVSILLRCVSRM